jgi:ribosomal subunit interface protein
METEPQIRFRNFDPPEELKTEVRRKVDDLEQFFEPIINCRVMVDVPHRRQRSGNRYKVRIAVRVPGDELVVNRDPGDDEKLDDVNFAVNATCEAMEGQLDKCGEGRRD